MLALARRTYSARNRIKLLANFGITRSLCKAAFISASGLYQIVDNVSVNYACTARLNIKVLTEEPRLFQANPEPEPSHW